MHPVRLGAAQYDQLPIASAEQDHHACPGDLVDDDFAWTLIEARMDAIKNSSVHDEAVAKVEEMPSISPPPADPLARAKWIQSFLNLRGCDLQVDGALGSESTEAIAEFLAGHAA